jgi:hypothetical protein
MGRWLAETQEEQLLLIAAEQVLAAQNIASVGIRALMGSTEKLVMSQTVTSRG